jgi:hypothetical protein
MTKGTEHRLTLRQADQARTDFAAIESDLEAIMERLSRLPTRTEQALKPLYVIVGSAGIVIAWIRAFLAALPLSHADLLEPYGNHPRYSPSSSLPRGECEDKPDGGCRTGVLHPAGDFPGAGRSGTISGHGKLAGRAPSRATGSWPVGLFGWKRPRNR